MDVTEWFDGSKTVPGQEGVYERAHGIRNLVKVYSYWNGDYWGLYTSTVTGAFKAKDDESSFQNMFWRGLKERPNEHA